ncbi:MAG: hypothetical protein ACYS0C_02500 [Planctomycetota bacterium]|jgi:hypothetical protein
MESLRLQIEISGDNTSVIEIGDDKSSTEQISHDNALAVETGDEEASAEEMSNG